MTVGVILYIAVYAVSEMLVYNYAKRNRFHNVKTAAASTYDYVILGASHALPFDFEDMNDWLEEMTGTRIINLSIAGGGVVPMRLILDYFLTEHDTRNVILFLDSFCFYYRDWNEDRLKDSRLFLRAPFDLTLARLLLSYGFHQGIDLSIAADYILGFSKINNADRFSEDISEDESRRFHRTYRPSTRRENQRIDYLYPTDIDEALFKKYLSEFEEMIEMLKSRGIRLIVIKPPIPTRFYEKLPNEAQFDAQIGEVLAREGVPFYDFSLVDNDLKLFYNTDHLNHDGVVYFFDNHLKQVLIQHGPSSQG